MKHTFVYKKQTPWFALFAGLIGAVAVGLALVYELPSIVVGGYLFEEATPYVVIGLSVALVLIALHRLLRIRAHNRYGGKIIADGQHFTMNRVTGYTAHHMEVPYTEITRISHNPTKTNGAIHTYIDMLALHHTFHPRHFASLTEFADFVKLLERKCSHAIKETYE